MIKWTGPDMFEAGDHGNKPFSIRVPALIITRGKMTGKIFSRPCGLPDGRGAFAHDRGDSEAHLHLRFLFERGGFVMSAPSDTMIDIVVFGGYVSGRTSTNGKPPDSPPCGRRNFRAADRRSHWQRRIQSRAADSFRRRHGSLRRENFGDISEHSWRRTCRENSNPLLYMGTKYDDKASPWANTMRT